MRIEFDPAERLVTVKIPERQLQALLRRLGNPFLPARIITYSVDSDTVPDGTTLIVEAEPDERRFREREPDVRTTPWGRLQPSVFLQDAVWVDAQGRVHPITSMPLDYVNNVIQFCHDNTDLIHAHLTAELNRYWELPEAWHDKPPPEIPRRDLFEDDFAAWLARCPLMEALRRRLEQTDPDNPQ